MITDDERRDIAAELRYTANDDLGGLSLQKNLAAITKAEDGSWRGVMRRLADLIEPEPKRTCRPVFMDWAGNPPYNESGARLDLDSLAVGCSECGCPWVSRSSRLPNYCPNCGAKVVRK